MPRSRIVVAALVLLAVAAFATFLGVARNGPPSGPAYVPGEVLLKFKPTAQLADRLALRAGLGAATLHTFKSMAEHWSLAPGISVDQAIQRLQSSGLIEYAEPNYLLSADIIPNDPSFPVLYGMYNTGQTINGVAGTPDADIDADVAWNVSTGSSNVIVAVIDTGVDYNHPELAANIWTNPGEIPGNGIDDDGNGYIDDVHGYDFYNNDGDPFDDNGHGTHCSGTIGAVGNNGIGVAGVVWNVKIMPVKFLSSGGSGSTANAVLSVQYATAMGANLSSNSWGGGGYSQTLYDAIADANAHGIGFVAAAGNGSSNTDSTPNYPSCYDLPNIISVAATDNRDQLASFSNYGAVTVDLAAPGVDVYSTKPGNTYGYLSGTSMATPHVAGACALVKSVTPGIPFLQIKQVLLNSVDHIASMAGKCVSNGRLNVFFAVAEPDTTAPGAVTDLAAFDPTSNTVSLSWTAPGDDGSTGTAAYYEVRYATAPIDETSWAAATRAGNEPAPLAAGSLQSMEVRNLVASTTYYFAIKAIDEWGNVGALSNVPSATTLGPPTGQVDPTSITQQLSTGGVANQTVTLSNIGVGTLDFSIPEPALGMPMSVPPDPLELGKDEPDPRPGILGSGGPDAFGYRWTDSDQVGGPTYAWTDISTTGTPLALTGDDATTNPIALGFNVPFYGTFFNSIRVCSNGWLSFTSAATSYSNQPLPNTGAPENLIAPFWDDLNPGGVNRTFFQSFGNRAIVQWEQIPHYGTTEPGTYTFQAIIESSGAITFQYKTVTGTLNSSTIGIQNATKTDGLTVAYNVPYVHNSLAVRINSIPRWLTVTPTSGRLREGQSKLLNLHMDASGLEGGTYPGTVNIQTNDPLHPVLAVSVSLHVLGAPDISLQPTSLDYGDSFLGIYKPLTLIVANEGTDTLHVTNIVSSSPDLTVSPTPPFDVPRHSSQNVTVSWRPSALGPFNATLTIQSNDPNQPSVVVPVTGNGIAAPVMVYNPTSMTQSLYSGQQAHQTLTVSNSGGSNLQVTAAADLGGGVEVSAADQTADGTGGPDGFGYKWKDSDTVGGPTYNFIDISSTGTLITFTSSDDGYSPIISMGMGFPFYGNTFSSMRVMTNGFLTFDTTDTSTRLTNYNLPSTSGAKNMIALYWDDLHLRSGNVKYKNDGTRFIVQYTNVQLYSGNTNNLTFQVQLYPDGTILLMYQSMAGTLTGGTIGIQNSTKTIGLPVVYNAAYVHSNLAVRITDIPDWLSVTPASATIPPGGSYNFDVKFDSTRRSGGTLNGAIVLRNNIPGDPGTRVPATLTVIGVPIVGIDPTSYDYGTHFTGYPYGMNFYVRNTGTDILRISSIYADDPTLSVGEPAVDGDLHTLGEIDLPPYTSRTFVLTWLPTAPMTLNSRVHVISNDPVNGNKTMPVTGVAIAPPVAVWSPASFAESLNVGDLVHRSLRLENQGATPLNFDTLVSLNSGATVVVDNSPELKKDEQDTRPGLLGSGGPDVYGYTWRDSDQAAGPTFGWVDISAIGTPIALNSDDQNVQGIPIGFPFPFYGASYTTINACSNGWLSFTDTTTGYTNYQLPSTSAPANLLAAFHDDLTFSSAGRAYYYNDGTRFILSYVGVPRLGSGGPYTFEVILYRNGRIVFQYLDMQGTRLNEATIGIQNAAKTDGLTVVYNANYVHNNLAVEFRPPAGWLVVIPEAGSVPAGGFVDLDVTFDATGMIGGDYSAVLDLNTNDPAHGLIRVPVSMHLTGIPDIDATPTPLVFPMTYVGFSSILTVNVKNLGTDVLYLNAVETTGDFSYYGVYPTVTLPPGASVPVYVRFTPTAAGTRTGELRLTSNDPDEGLFIVPLEGPALIPPEIHVDPASLSGIQPPGTTTTRTVQVCNTGGSDLEWQSGNNIISGAQVTQYEPYELGKEEVDTHPGVLGNGGPDVFGYRWRDSDDPGGPVFDWIDITGIGTQITALNGDDQNVQGIPIGFPFKFYGNSFSTLNVSSNGWLSFTNTTSALSNYALPSTSAPENLLAGFWDDLDMRPASGTGKAYYWSDGTKFVLSFITAPRYSTHEPYTFQFILYQSGKIVFQYLTMPGTRLNEATIGIQNGAKNDGLTVVFNAHYVHDNMAVQFQTIPEWATLSPSSGVVPAGTCQDVTATFDSTDLEHGVHHATYDFASNDPYTPMVTVPVELTVNYKPVADAGPDQIVECRDLAGTAQLHGSGSDRDNDPLTFAWTVPGVTLDDPTSPTPIGSFPLGTTVASLVVNDTYENSDPDTATVSVIDTTPPMIVCPSAVTVECQSSLQAMVHLAPATASDACYGGATIVNSHTAGGADASGSYPLGATDVVFTATDGSGNSSSCAVRVTVQDTIAPIVSVEATPDHLWPPNHKMVDVNYNVTVNEACDPNPGVKLWSAYSSEPDDAVGGGDGATVDDIQGASIGTPDYSVMLRAEREGKGTGRIYTVGYQVTDVAGNVGSASDQVVVPHDLAQVVEPLNITLSGSANTTVSWPTVDGVVSYDVIRGRLENLREQGSSVNLGAVTCLLQDTTGTSTVGHEDRTKPQPGHAFFYLVQFFDGIENSSYGTESAGKARVVGSGDCK